MLLVNIDQDLILRANPAAAELLHYTNEEDLVRTPLSGVYPQKESLLQLAEDIVECGRSWTDKIRCETCDGRVLPGEITATTIFDNGKNTFT